MTRFPTRAIAALLLCAGTTAAAASGPQRRLASTDPPPVAPLTLEPGCSPTHANVGTLSASWRGSRTAPVAQRVDITTHKGGFDKGLFVTLDRLQRGARTRRLPASNLPEKFFRAALDLTATSVAVDPAGVVRLELEGVQPGLYYTVRTAAGSATIPIPPCLEDRDERGRRR